jgi:hypothetical protein
MRGSPTLRHVHVDRIRPWFICGTEPLQAALGRACQFGRFGWDDVRSILAAGGAAPPAQVVVGERVSVTGLPSVPCRELASYRWTA